MSQHDDEQPAAAPARPPGNADAAPDGRPLHLRSFKLRFAAQREPGRSDVSLVKPLGLPPIVSEAPHRAGGAADDASEAAALHTVQRMFAQGPREKYHYPLTSAHVYGWWWEEAPRMAAAPFSDRRLHHHIRDSSWLKARLLLLAADDKLKQR